MMPRGKKDQRHKNKVVLCESNLLFSKYVYLYVYVCVCVCMYVVLGFYVLRLLTLKNMMPPFPFSKILYIYIY